MKNKKIIFWAVILLITIIAGLSLGVLRGKEKRGLPGGYKGAGTEQLARTTVLSSKKSGAVRSQGKIDIKLLFSPDFMEESAFYEVKSGDSLSSIAKEFGTTIDLIKASNHLKSDIIKLGQRLKIISKKFKIVVNVSNNTLSLYLDDKLVKIYPVGTAKDRNTPIGEFKIINKIVNPDWYAPGGGVYPYGDPKNIIGTRWMGINEPGYGIHGTVDPDSIGKYVSAGCVRMHNKDVEELFKIVPEGTEVSIIGEKNT
jgi:LysM repeat protein